MQDPDVWVQAQGLAMLLRKLRVGYDTEKIKSQLCYCEKSLNEFTRLALRFDKTDWLGYKTKNPYSYLLKRFLVKVTLTIL